MCTIIFASERVKYELDEMPAIAAILMSKFRSSMCQLYGKDFPQAVMDEGAAMGRQIPVSPHVAQCLSVLPASPHEKIDKLQKIATQFGAPFDKEKAAAEMLPRNPRMPTVPSPYDKPGSGGVKFYQPATKPDGAQRPVQQPTTTVLTSAAVTSMTTTTPAAAPPRVTTPNKDGWRVQLGDGLATTLPPPPHALAAAAPLAPARPPVTAEKVAPSSPDPWAPLPPLNQNLGYTFDARLDQVAQFMVHKQSGSQSGSQSGGTTPHRGNSLVPQQSDASITSKMSGGHGTMAVSDAGTGTEAPSEGGHREESDAEDDLAKRLAALRAM